MMQATRHDGDTSGTGGATPRPGAFLPAFPRLLRGVIRRLPVAPPSFALALALNRLLLPRLDASMRAELSGRAVELEVSDVGLRCLMVLGPKGFRVAPAAEPVALRISAAAAIFWSLLQGRDDPDTMFFDRSLVMEGDTEFGLMLKNTLDAIGPILPASPREWFTKRSG